MSQRVAWVDWLKFIGILAVILGHTASPFSVFIFSWHMPLFFFLSGFFIKKDEFFGHYVVIQAKRLLIPYFLFSLIGLAVGITKNVLLHRPPLNLLFELKGIFLSMDMTSLMNHYGFVLWFLPSLFWARIIVFVLQKYIQNTIFQMVCVGLLFVLSLTVDMPFALGTGLNAVLWVYAGSVVFPLIQSISKHVGVGMILLLGGMASFFSIPMLNMATLSYSRVIANLMWAGLCIAVLMFLCQYIATHVQSNYVAWWAKSTFFLFVVHPYTNNFGYLVGGHMGVQYWYVTLILSLLLLWIGLVAYQWIQTRYRILYV
jgi:acyltransferase